MCLYSYVLTFPLYTASASLHAGDISRSVPQVMDRVRGACARSESHVTASLTFSAA